MLQNAVSHTNQERIRNAGAEAIKVIAILRRLGKNSSRVRGHIR